MTPRRYANLTNGLAYPHDDVCQFLSTHGHNCGMGYFRLDSMPYSAVIRLLKGQPIRVIDASPSLKMLTDGLRFGLTTWAVTFNRAIRREVDRVAPWQTSEIRRAAYRSKTAKKTVKRIRRLQKTFGDSGPVRIGPGELIEVECHQRFRFDDRPERLPVCV